MTRVRPFFLFLMMLAVSIPAMGAGATANDTWVETDQQEFSVDGIPIALSPDGKWLAGTGLEKDFCIWSIPDLGEYCDDAGIRPREDTVNWSPDSSAVAFSDDPALYLVDSDIMIFDVASKQISNLTDDPDEVQEPDVFSTEPGITHADIYPMWSADGETLYFVRGDFGNERKTTEVMSLDLASGEISPYFTVSPDLWFIVYSAMYETPDGSLLISVYNYDGNDGQNGIWRIAPGGSRIDPVLLSGSDETLAAIAVSDVSTDGTTAVVVSQIGLSTGQSEVSPFMVLDLVTGEVVSVPDQSDELPWTAISGYPQFIGTGSEFAYQVTYPDSAEREILIGGTDSYPLVESLDEKYIRGIQVTDAGTLLVRGADGFFLIVATETTADESTPIAPCSCAPPEGN